MIKRSLESEKLKKVREGNTEMHIEMDWQWHKKGRDDAQTTTTRRIGRGKKREKIKVGIHGLGYLNARRECRSIIQQSQCHPSSPDRKSVV